MANSPQHNHRSNKEDVMILKGDQGGYDDIKAKLSTIKGRTDSNRSYDAGAKLDIYAADMSFERAGLQDQQPTIIAKLEQAIRNNLNAEGLTTFITSKSGVQGGGRVQFLVNTDDETGKNPMKSDRIADKVLSIMTQTAQDWKSKLGSDKSNMQAALDELVAESADKAKQAATERKRNELTMSADAAIDTVQKTTDLIGMRNSNEFSTALGAKVAATFPTKSSLDEAGIEQLEALVKDALTNGLDKPGQLAKVATTTSAGRDNHIKGVQKTIRQDTDEDVTADKIKYATGQIVEDLETRYKTLAITIAAKSGQRAAGM